jgi:FAD/FMN-containing dehydrogenase
MSESRSNRTPLVQPGGIDHHVADMTATLSAVVTLKAAREKLAEAGQWLPIEGNASLTLGRLIETNSTGPLRLGYGAWRDLLLGAQFLNGRDELITAGGRTVKNVAGYDLTKFMVGQRGVFGRLVTVTTRTYKRPDGAILAKFRPNLGLVNRVMPTDLRPQWMALTAEALCFGYLADERTLAYWLDHLPKLEPASIERRTIKEDIEHRRKLWRTEGERTFRVAVAPAQIADFIAAAQPASWVADAAFGIIIGGCAPENMPGICDAAKQFAGTATIFAGDELEFEPANSGQRALLDRLKQAFDPDGRLAPLPWRK